MSGRKLGGGRILGSGKGLAPADGRNGNHISSSSPHAAARAPSPYAPSDATSTPSRGSPNGFDLSQSPSSTTSPLPDVGQDLAANISVGQPANRSGGGSSTLVCPICNEEMVTLLQLNRHIDDTHQELPEIQQDEVKTWFDKQVLKAKKFQPLSLINQKLRGLDVFESNESSPVITYTSPNGNGSSSTGGRPGETVVVDPDELITRKHWQRSTGADVCTDPTCAKGLGPINGSVNCRSCGKLFCEEHTMYQMRLSRAALYEPVRGFWARVCETCFKSRPGYNDHRGTERDLTGAFESTRRKRIERQNLEIARLEKRLTRLTHLLADPPADLVASSGAKNARKAIEQSVVTWEDDSAVPRCPFCQQEFGSWTFRRHHCRICGRVVCADPQTACSTEVGLSVVAAKEAKMTTVTAAVSAKTTSEKQRPHTPDKSGGSGGVQEMKPTTVNVDVRMCRDCKATIFSKRDFEEAMALKPPDQRAYETLRQFELGIRRMMPLFQRALQSLQPEAAVSSPSSFSARGTASPAALNKPPPSHAQIQEAAKIRKRLMDSFTKYNLAATRLRDMPTGGSAAQQRLQRAIYTAASTFLHANMVPLKHVPRMLRANQQNAANGMYHRKLLSSLNAANGGSNGGGNQHPLRNGEMVYGDGNDAGDTGSIAGSEVSSAAVSALATEEKDLREKLVVLEEQRFLVQQMVDNAHGSRRFEEVGALNRNLHELDGEISQLKQQVSQVENRWDDLYGTGVS